MESIAAWAAEDGHRVECYGLDLIPSLAALARRRLPHRADRIFVGNLMSWRPSSRFHFARTGVEYVPRTFGPRWPSGCSASTPSPVVA